jgi:hypothetical protein
LLEGVGWDVKQVFRSGPKSVVVSIRRDLELESFNLVKHFPPDVNLRPSKHLRTCGQCET